MPKEANLHKTASTNDWHRLLDTLSGKKDSRLRSTLSWRRRSGNGKDQFLSLNTLEDGSFQRLSCPNTLRIDLRDETGSTPLIVASLCGAVEAASCLVAYGANINSQDSSGNTALHVAAWQERERSIEVVEMLLKNGANTNIVNVHGRTPLHNAAQVQVVMMLIDHDADVHIKNEDGDCPLDIAARFNREEVVSFLLNHDISVTKSTRALREAARLGRNRIVQLLLDMGADVAAEDPDTKDTALHLAVRYTRLDTVETLLAFGADPYQANSANETAHELVTSIKDQYQRQKLLGLIEEYKDKDIKTPAIVLNERRQRKAKQAIGQYHSVNQLAASTKKDPILRVLNRWCEDTAQWRSNADVDWPVTNILSEDPSSEWRATIAGPQWVAFMFPHLYTITGISIIARPGSHVPKDVQLEVADGLEGPWRVVKSFTMSQAPGPDATLDMLTNTITQFFSEFHATSQFWRLHILKTYVSTSPCALNQIRFHGFDALMPKWFAELGMTEYLQPFLSSGINQLNELKHLPLNKLSHLINLPGHRKKFELALRELRGEKHYFDRLVFSRPPPTNVSAGQPCPMFEVQANPGSDQEVELVVHGNAHVTGTLRKRLLPNGSHPSVAFFDDIVLAPAGQYLLEVRSVQDPNHVYIKSPKPITVEPPAKKRSAIEVLFADYRSMLEF